MSNGWRYTLHAGFFGVAGPLVGFALISLPLMFLAPASGIGATLADPDFWSMAAAAYQIGGVPALVTGWAVAFGAGLGHERNALYLEGAFIGFFSPMVWLPVLAVLHDGVSGHVLLGALSLSIFAGVIGVLSALVCIRLAWRLRPASAAFT